MQAMITELNDSTTNQIRIWGPPGCGKTTYLSKQLNKGVERLGSDRVLVTSFTRAAAAELASRNRQLPKPALGTLHSNCYRAIGSPEVAEGHIRDWNKAFPQFRLTAGGSVDIEEPDPEIALITPGDAAYAQLGILRAKMVGQDLWPMPARRFAAKWEEWKSSNGFFDFTDLVEIGLRDFKIAPGRPSLIVVDEPQDLTRLQMSLISQWGRNSDYLMLAADDDQTIYTFAGAAPEVLLESSGDEYFKHVLSQSYRVPRLIHAASKAWIERVSLRQPKDYRPRPVDGEIRVLNNASYRNVHPAVEDAERQLAAGRSVMFLASCSYMLEPLKRSLRERGLAFHNPYRRKRLDWNPLLPGGTHGPSPVDRVRAWLKPRPEAGGHRWLGQDMSAWSSWFREGVGIRERVAASFKGLSSDFEVTEAMLQDLFEPDTMIEFFRVLNGSLEEYVKFWTDRLPVNRRKTAKYAVTVALNGGMDALTDNPRIIVGTGHSVKGGEADVVYLFPDLSASGARSWEGPRAERDSIIRLGYVMMTRARESLVVCAPAGARYMPIAEVARRARGAQ